MIHVPLLDLKAQYAQFRTEALSAIESVCASQHFILGENVRAFEAEIAEYCGATHAVGVSSGTDALLLALMALGIGPGAEVRVAMSVVIIGGVVVSTFFSLIVVPCLYDLMAPHEDRSRAAREELDAAEEAELALR